MQSSATETVSPVERTTRPPPSADEALGAKHRRSITARFVRIGLLASAALALAVTCHSAGGPSGLVSRVLHYRGSDGGVVVPADDAIAPDAAAPALPESHECEHDEDCARRGRRGRCFSRGLLAQYTQAFRDCPEGRAWRDTHAVGTCVYDECRDDGPSGDTCAAGTRCAMLEMVPFPRRVCTTAQCTSDRECRHSGLGTCAAYLAGGRCARGGWSCSYPRDVCAPRDPVRMCPVRPGLIAFCAPRDGRFTCVDEPAIVGGP